jgi:hypothetical protein
VAVQVILVEVEEVERKRKVIDDNNFHAIMIRMEKEQLDDMTTTITVGRADLISTISVPNANGSRMKQITRKRRRHPTQWVVLNETCTYAPAEGVGGRI